MDVSAVGTHVADCRWPFLAAACGAHLASGLLKAVAWRALLAPLAGAGRLHRMDLAGALFIGSMVNAGLPGRLGEVAKVIVARRRIARRGGTAGAPEVAGSIAAENVVSALIWALVAAALVTAVPAPAGVREVVALLALGCAAVTGAVLLCPRRDGPARAGAAGLLGRCWRAVHGGVAAMRDGRALGIVVAACLLQSAAQWAAIALVLVATGLGDVALVASGPVLVMLSLARSIPVLPGGLGAAQATTILPLTALYGVEPGAAFAFALLLGLSETSVNVSVGAAFLAREARAAAAGASRITLRNAIRSSSVLRASRAARM